MIKFFKKKLIIPIYGFLDNNMGVFLFNNLNSLSYNFYNFIYRKFIFKKKNKSTIADFLKNGFQKIGKANPKIINDIKTECIKQMPQDNEFSRFYFKKNENIIKSIKEIVNENCKDYLKDLEQCYKANIKLSWIGLFRNYSYKSEDEKYSNYFHTDGYNLNLIKLFINLQDVKSENGPMQIVKKKYNRKLINLSKVNSLRRIKPNLSKEEYNEMINENTGEIGDIFICDTTKLIHRAGVPSEKNYRDMIFLEFVVLPFSQVEKNNYFSLENYFPNIFLDEDNWYSKKIAKPGGLKNITYNLFKYLRYSFNYD